MIKKINYIIFFLSISSVFSQTNNASGNITKCAIWGTYGYPLQHTNSVSDTRNISDGTTVTINQTWSMGTLNLNGANSVIDFAGTTNAIDFQNNGTPLTCRIDLPYPAIPRATGYNSYSDINLTQVPYTGTWRVINWAGYSIPPLFNFAYAGGTYNLYTGTISNRTQFLSVQYVNGVKDDTNTVPSILNLNANDWITMRLLQLYNHPSAYVESTGGYNSTPVSVLYLNN